MTTYKPTKLHHFRYTIDVSELGYAQLMQLVMKYGTGTSAEGISTGVDLRIDLAEAKPRIVIEEGEEQP